MPITPSKPSTELVSRSRNQNRGTRTGTLEPLELRLQYRNWDWTEKSVPYQHYKIQYWPLFVLRVIQNSMQIQSKKRPIFGPLTHSIVACRSGTLFCCCSPGLYAAGSPPAGRVYIIVLCAGWVTGLCLDCTSFSLDEGRASGMSDSVANWNYKT